MQHGPAASSGSNPKAPGSAGGYLLGFAESDREGQAFVAAFREGLQKLGWVGGRNIRIDARWAAGDTGLMQRFAKELVAWVNLAAWIG